MVCVHVVWHVCACARVCMCVMWCGMCLCVHVLACVVCVHVLVCVHVCMPACILYMHNINTDSLASSLGPAAQGVGFQEPLHHSYTT